MHRGNSLAVIIPTFNRSKLLSGCLQALVQQKAFLEQILVVDDGSTDDTQDVIFRFQKEYPFIVSFRQDNKGIQAALNRALGMVTTDLMAIIDDDTLIEDGWAKEACKAFELNPRMDALTGPIINDNNSILGRVFDIINFSKWNAIRKFSVVDDIPTCNAVYRMKSIGGLNFREGRKNAHYRDSLFNFDLRSRGGVIIFSPCLKVRHRAHGEWLTWKDFTESLCRKAQGFFWDGHLCHGRFGLVVKYCPPFYFLTFFFLLKRSFGGVRQLFDFCVLSPFVLFGQCLFVTELTACWINVLKQKFLRNRSGERD